MSRIGPVWSLLLVAAIVIAVGLGCGGGNRAGGSTTTDGPKTVAANPAIPIDAKALSREYDNNEIAADQKYKGKVMAVTGKVDDIAETFGNVTIQMQGYKEIGMNVMCSFEDNAKAAVANVKKGSTITMIGTVTGATAGLYVDMDECHF